MYRLAWIIASFVVLASGVAYAFSFATGDCATGGCAAGEDFLHSNANEIDAALDALEAGTSITAFDVDIVTGDTNDDDDLDVAAGGTGVSTLTDGGVLIGNGTGDIVATAVMTEGQLLIGDGTTDPAVATVSGDVAIASTGTATIQGDAVALSTDTTGNYVATIADSGSSEVTVTGSGSEGAAVTLAIASSITRDSELSAYTVGTAAPVDGSDACTEGDMWLDHTANKVYWCVDSSTDDWFGVALSDTP